MTHPRGLTAEEAEAWEKLAETVTPLNPPRHGEGSHAEHDGRVSSATAEKATGHAVRIPMAKPLKPTVAGTARTPLRKPVAGPSYRAGEDRGLDSHWDRRLKSGAVVPDFTLDLHGHTLDQAHDRLESGLFQAKAMDARLVLLIAGKPRPVDAADRGSRRGAIRAKILDWLAAGPHGGDIAAIRKAHRRHGGDGALYLVLKRRR